MHPLVLNLESRPTVGFLYESKNENQVFVPVFSTGKASHEVREMGLGGFLKSGHSPNIVMSFLIISYVPFLVDS